jgi:hypothetical protein
MAADARSNVRAEAAQDVSFIRECLSTQACIDSRIAQLQDCFSDPEKDRWRRSRRGSLGPRFGRSS